VNRASKVYLVGMDFDVHAKTGLLVTNLLPLRLELEILFGVSARTGDHVDWNKITTN
jgi:hypothetical protein